MKTRPIFSGLRRPQRLWRRRQPLKAGGKVEKAQEDAGATVKRGVSLRFTIDAVKNLLFTLVCWRNVFFSRSWGGKLYWKTEFFSRLLLPRTRVVLPPLKQEVVWRTPWSQRARYGHTRDYGWVGMTKTGGGGIFFFKSENKSAENFDTSVLPQLQFLVHFWCFSFFFSETFWDGNLQEEDTEVSQFFSSLQHGGPRPLVKHCCARRDFSS